MKTTIEIKGYQIVIDETDEMVTVTAVKDDETVEEFSLDLTEEGEGFDREEGEEGSEGEDIKAFGDFEEEEDFSGDDLDDELESQDDEDEDEDDDDDDDEREGSALESFGAYIKKRK